MPRDIAMTTGQRKPAATPTPASAGAAAAGTAAAGAADLRALVLDKAFVDLRTYTIALRRMPDFLDVFDRLGLPVLLETLGSPLGYWTSYVGPLNQFIHAWGYDSLDEYETRGRARDTHPDWPAYLSASRELIVAQECRLIRRVALKGVRQRG